jgi:hypothetical protein
MMTARQAARYAALIGPARRVAAFDGVLGWACTDNLLVLRSLHEARHAVCHHGRLERDTRAGSAWSG